MPSTSIFMGTQSRRNDTDEIKDRLFVWDVVRRWYKADVPDRCGLYHCPWRDDDNPSFSIFADGKMWKDHSSGESNDVIGLLTRDGKTFREAVSILSEWSNIKEVRFERREKQKRELATLPSAPPEYKKIAIQCRKEAESWKETNNVLRQLCARKRWDPRLMEELIRRGVVGLNKGRVAWIFERGIKIRGSAFVSREDRWLCGKSVSCIFLDMMFNHRTNLVFMTEGETDAITVLLSGACKKGSASVLGVSGASVKPHPELLKPMVYGKTVVLVGDNDKAGRGFVKRMTGHLALLGVRAKFCEWMDLPYKDVGDFAAAEGNAAVADWLRNSYNWSEWT